MRPSTLKLLCCPRCHGVLSLYDELPPHDRPTRAVETGALTCQHCELIYPVRNGIASLVYTTENTLPDRRFARFYDWLSLAYGPLTKLGFLPFGGDRKARMEILDRLELGGGQVLEVSVGTGSNLPYLFESQDVGDVFGLDISPGQLECCRRFVKKRGWVVNLFHGTAEALPFKAESFDSVFHIGGINFFSEKKRAIEEMIRVARPGSRIVIADESERAARALSRIPGFARGPGGNRLDTSVPVHLVPDAMEEVEIRGIWKAHGRYHGYCLEFRKPNRS